MINQKTGNVKVATFSLNLDKSKEKEGLFLDFYTELSMNLTNEESNKLSEKLSEVIKILNIGIGRSHFDFFEDFFETKVGNTDPNKKLN